MFSSSVRNGDTSFCNRAPLVFWFHASHNISGIQVSATRFGDWEMILMFPFHNLSVFLCRFRASSKQETANVGFLAEMFNTTHPIPVAVEGRIRAKKGAERFSRNNMRWRERSFEANQVARCNCAHVLSVCLCSCCLTLHVNHYHPLLNEQRAKTRLAEESCSQLRLSYRKSTRGRKEGLFMSTHCRRSMCIMEKSHEQKGLGPGGDLGETECLAGSRSVLIKEPGH